MKLTMTRIQKKYAGQIVALSKDETKILAASSDTIELRAQLDAQDLKPGEYILFGPVPKFGTYQIY